MREGTINYPREKTVSGTRSSVEQELDSFDKVLSSKFCFSCHFS